ncbi:MAG: MFS transporter [Salinarimonas sp.]|nr:MFS transporter [Salinarimonas sp.]
MSRFGRFGFIGLSRLRWLGRRIPSPGLGRDLNLLLGGQFVGNAGSRIFDLVLIWFALELSDSYAAVGFLVFLRFAPYALFGLVCGWLSDRLDRRRLIVGAELFRAILLVAAAGLLLAGMAPLVVLGAVAFLLTAARTLFQPAVQGLLPQLAHGQALIRANAVLHGSIETVGVAAPVLGGLLLLVLPVPAILTLIAATFILSAGLSRAVHVPVTLAPYAPATGRLQWRDLVDEYASLWRVLSGARRDVRAAIVVNVAGILGVAGVLSLLIPIFVKDHLAAGPDVLGLLWSIMALGTLAGAVFSVRIAPRWRERGMLLGWLVYGLLLGALAIPADLVVIFAIGFILAAAGAIADILFATLIQERMPGEHVSKTFAGFSTLANTGEAVSAPALGLVAGLYGIGAAFAAGAALPVIAALAGLLWLSGRRMTQRDAP